MVSYRTKIIGAFFGFFTLIIAADFFMITVAHDTFTGTVTLNPYQKGIDIDKINKRQQDAIDIGWKGHLTHDANGTITFELLDQDKRAISGVRVISKIANNTTDKHDVLIELKEGADGKYTGLTKFSKTGYWDIKIKATKGDVEYFDHKKIYHTSK